MATRRPICALWGLFFLSGTIILLFLLILAGAYDRRPLNQIFFIQADTSGIPNAPDGICHWTLYNFCEGRNGRNYDCRRNDAAYPFLPQKNFDTEVNVPPDFIQNPDRFYYLSRFLYAFYIIDVALACFAFVAGLLALCSRLGGVVSAALTALALFCVSFSAAIMTACFVLGQQAFRDDGRFARVGVKAFAFTWTCVALLFLASIASCLSSLGSRREEPPYRTNGALDGAAKGRFAGVGSVFNRKNKSRNRASYDSQRKINKEYTPAAAP